MSNPELHGLHKKESTRLEERSKTQLIQLCGEEGFQQEEKKHEANQYLGYTFLEATELYNI